jgi:hypothetical protein
MQRYNLAVLAVSLCTVLAVASCGSNDPTRVDRPPVVNSYSPTTRTLNAFVGDTLQFQIDAFDPDHDALTTSYAIDDRFVFDGTTWNYVIEDTGAVSVRGTVSDGEHTSYIDWHLTTSVPINLPPVIETSLPQEASPVLVIGNSMNFAVIAADPELDALTYSFAVNDSLVATQRQFVYKATSVGIKRIRVVVSDGDKIAWHDWQLKVTTVPDNIPPATVLITLAETGQEPGRNQYRMDRGGPRRHVRSAFAVPGTHVTGAGPDRGGLEPRQRPAQRSCPRPARADHAHGRGRPPARAPDVHRGACHR